MLVQAAAASNNPPSAASSHPAETADKLGRSPKPPSSARLRVFLDTIVALKNNRHKSSKGGSAGGAAALPRLQKALQLMGKSGEGAAGGSLAAFKVRWDELKDAEQKGRWWLVGSAWEGRQHGATDAELPPLKGPIAPADAQSRLLLLAVKQGMNTELRRQIFVAIMGAEDYVDGFERLSKIKLAKQQRAEISRVILQCNAQEGVYNGFYALLACAHLRLFPLKQAKKNALCPSLPKCRTPTFAICPQFNPQLTCADRIGSTASRCTLRCAT